MNKQLKAELLLLLITIIWGSTFPLMKSVLTYIPVFGYLTFRFLTASIFLAIIFYKNIKNMSYRAILFGFLIGLMLFGGMSLQVAGLKYTTASKSGFITGLNVVMVPILSALLLKKMPPKKAILGVCLATFGLVFLSGGLALNFNKGDFLTLLCAFCFALQIILIDKFTSEEDAKAISIIQSITVSILCFILWTGFEQSQIQINPRVIFTIIFTGAIATAFAYGAQTIVQQYTTPTRTALILTLEPVFATVFALIIPNIEGETESLQFSMIVGCVLILTGMIITELNNNKIKQFLNQIFTPKNNKI